VRSWANVQVIERAHSVDQYDRDKGFMYSVDGRGYSLLQLVGLAEQLPPLSVPTSEFRLAYVTPEEGVKPPITLPIKDDGRVTSWLPRHVSEDCAAPPSSRTYARKETSKAIPTTV
jgi:hypothetical protein